MAADLKFPASHIDVDGIPFNAELSAAWHNTALADAQLRAPEGAKPGKVEGRLSRSGRDIVVHGRIRTTVETDCVRCLRPAQLRINTKLSLLLQPVARPDARGRKSGHQKTEEYEFDSREADMDTYDGENVVLDDFVREAIMLAAPSFPLCRRSCPGIPSSPGMVDDSPLAKIDPRLAPLSAFRKKDDGAVTLQDIVDAAAARAEAMGSKPILKSNNRGPGKKKGKKR